MFSNSYAYACSVKSLTKREMEVVTLVARGYSNRRIAHTLGISHHTVRNCLHSAKLRLGIDGNRTQLVIECIIRRIIKLDDVE